MPAISVIAADLISTPVPVLMVDTCALLDIVRAPLRKQADHLERAIRIRGASTASPAKCRLIIASISVQEFADNHPNIQREMRVFLDSLQENSIQVYTACGFLNVSAIAPNQSAFQPLVVELDRLARDLTGLSVTIDSDVAVINRARTRVVDKKRPVRGGDVFKDAEIVETFLELARQLRAASFAPPLVFLSSNTSDFCESDKQTSHTDLRSDFTPLTLQFATIWPEAHQMLGI